MPLRVPPRLSPYGGCREGQEGYRPKGRLADTLHLPSRSPG
jgi:hypothetical protein